MKELPKAYNFSEREDSLYKMWEDRGFFNPDNLEGEPYTIMMPPPNVTGILHLGHALENTLMDVVIRYHRMNGKKALLVPGTDHAAVATQAKVEKLLVEQGVSHPRDEFGREGLLEKIREYAEGSKATILKQVRKMGTSADWSRLAYTFDEPRSKAVNAVFKKMYEDGLIYRGYRVVNWSVAGQSTCSDDELEYEEREGKLYTFTYSKDFPITIATTRPETKVGDTAVAVHPEDARYKDFIGKTFPVNFCGVDLHITVIADDTVDPEFGTGALGVTPAHSPIDFDMYEKQKAAGTPIELIQVIGEDGKMTAAAGRYAGMTVLEAREAIVEDLRANGLLQKEETTVQRVGKSDRFKDVVEALPMTQWFVAVNKEIPGKGKSFKDIMKETVTTGYNGNPDKKVVITPDRFDKIYFNWIDNLRDWCISRQIWWGHRIPIWYRGEEIVCSEEMPEGDGWMQDEDTLDTWFSSGTWTFSTLGWPEKTADLETFHPTSFMQMGYEIIFFWMARMILMTTYAVDDIPFKDVYIHGLVRNKEGKKFSKSDGNTADPLDVIATYGTDALRYALIAGISPGNDLRFYDEKIESSRNLVTKIWNVARFMMTSIGDAEGEIRTPVPQTDADKWILGKLSALVAGVTEDMEAYRFSMAATRLTEFTRDDLADWYLEIAKVEGNKSDMLRYILSTLLALWHPFMPFVTEEIWQTHHNESSVLMVSAWPKAADMPAHESYDDVQQAIVAVRAIRTEYKIPAGAFVDVQLVSPSSVLQQNLAVFTALSRAKDVQVVSEMTDTTGFAMTAIGETTVYVHVAGSVDKEKELERIEKELAQVVPYISTLEKKLANAEFTENAPAAVVQKEQEKLEEAKAKQASLESQKEQLSV